MKYLNKSFSVYYNTQLPDKCCCCGKEDKAYYYLKVETGEGLFCWECYQKERDKQKAGRLAPSFHMKPSNTGHW